MKMDSEQVLDSIFLSYNKILKRFQLLGVTTKYGKEITHKDLRKAIEVMLKKHPTCRWRSEKVKSRKYFILAEGYAWLTQVYFQKEKSLIDADVDFFEDRIRQYEELLKVEHNKIVGSGTNLDTARFIQFLAKEVTCNPKDVEAYVIGEHGNSSVALWSNARIKGISIDKFLDNIDNEDKFKEEVSEKIRDKAFQIIKGKGATHFGIANCLLDFTRAILLDEKKIIMTSAYLDGEYNNKGLYTGVPAVIGANGCEKILEMDISKKEQEMFDKSCKDLEGKIRCTMQLINVFG